MESKPSIRGIATYLPSIQEITILATSGCAARCGHSFSFHPGYTRRPVIMVPCRQQQYAPSHARERSYLHSTSASERNLHWRGCSFRDLQRPCHSSHCSSTTHRRDC